jgi:hypothetical protein
MKQFKSIISIFIVICFASCSKELSQEGLLPNADPIVGEWTWVKSVSPSRYGVQTSTPATTNTTRSMQFSTNGNMVEKINAQPTSGTYQLGVVNEAQQSADNAYRLLQTSTNTNGFKFRIVHDTLQMTQYLSSQGAWHSYVKTIKK